MRLFGRARSGSGRRAKRRNNSGILAGAHTVTRIRDVLARLPPPPSARSRHNQFHLTISHIPQPWLNNSRFAISMAADSYIANFTFNEPKVNKLQLGFR